MGKIRKVNIEINQEEKMRVKIERKDKFLKRTFCRF